LALAVLCAPALADVPKPESMLKQVLQYDGLGQYGRAYDRLVPGQKKIINRSKFVDCMGKTLGPFGGFSVTSFKKIDQYRDPIHVTGVTQKPIVALTIKYAIQDDNGRTEKDTKTWHAVWAGGRWTWMLGNPDVAEYRAGRCPS
jgi:hypothetical protein